MLKNLDTVASVLRPPPDTILAVPSSSVARPSSFKKLKVAYTFCGDENISRGIPALLRNLGHTVMTADRRNGIDLDDDSEWANIMEFIKTADFILLSPPCGTFSPSRRHHPGPKALRSSSEPYGLKAPPVPFTSAEKLQLQLGTMNAIKSCLAARGAVASRCGFALEYPSLIFDGQASLCQLQEALDLDKIQGVFDWSTDQCRYGPESRKPTTFKVFSNGDKENG